MGPGILLIHGFTGSPEDFGPLVQALGEACPDAELIALPLPGHDGPSPEFAQEAFLAAIGEASASLTSEGRELIVVGHSTGGILALAAIEERGLAPRLLVLAGVPNRIDGAYLRRWNAHSQAMSENSRGRGSITFTSLARMVALINAIGSRSIEGCPVLLLHGLEDELVPQDETLRWRERIAPGAVRTVLVPGAGHHLFQGEGGDFACDVLVRAVRDAAYALSEEEGNTLARLVEEEPELAKFLAVSPASARHLLRSPSGCVQDYQPSLEPAGEPVFANIEITTRCNLRCVFCARTASGRAAEDMAPETFQRILDLLPHAYRITLVGLGEPLLHPGVVECVAMASAQGRRVALATNALLLTPELSRDLLAAGLDGITFSLDAPTPELAAQVRAGTVLDKAIANIKAFSALAKDTRPVARAVFSAVSMTTLPFLEELVRTVAGLDVDVLMLSDLNFRANLSQTLWQNTSDAVETTVRQAIRTAFALRLPVLSVRGLEAFALPRRYQQHLLVPPAQLYTRSALRTHCCSPWQTLAVAVDGTLTLCDCQPDRIVGKLLEQPFGELWQGAVLAEHRRRMLSDAPPEACAICPRF